MSGGKLTAWEAVVATITGYLDSLRNPKPRKTLRIGDTSTYKPSPKQKHGRGKRGKGW